MSALLIIIVITVAGAGYYIDLRLHPYAPCRRCSDGRGRGRNKWSRSSAWGSCKACGGSGKRLRFGARERR